MSRFKPINDFVLIEPSAAVTETEGGIAVPETAQERAREGIVLAAGPGRWEHGVEIPMEVRVGDKVQFGRYAGVDIQIDGQDLLVMREEEVLGVVGTLKPMVSRFAVDMYNRLMGITLTEFEGNMLIQQIQTRMARGMRLEAASDSNRSGSEGEAQSS